MSGVWTSEGSNGRDGGSRPGRARCVSQIEPEAKSTWIGARLVTGLQEMPPEAHKTKHQATSVCTTVVVGDQTAAKLGWVAQSSSPRSFRTDRK